MNIEKIVDGGLNELNVTSQISGHSDRSRSDELHDWRKSWSRYVVFGLKGPFRNGHRDDLK
jgi:hypothetical protein